MPLSFRAHETYEWKVLMVDTVNEPITVRIPIGMRARIREQAKANRRSMNSEIVYHLNRALAAENEKGPAEAATSPDHDQNHTPVKDGGIDA